MQKLKLGELQARLAGGPDREGGGDGPVLVLCHGYGAPGDDLASMWRVLDVPRSMRFVFPEAPLSLGQMMVGVESRAWWQIDTVALQQAMAQGQERDLTKTRPEGLDQARAALVSLLDAVQSELGVSSERVFLGGFSQGGMVALDTALRDERPLGGLVLLSTTLLCEDEWRPLMTRRAGLRVFQSHGRRDPLLPFSVAEQLTDLLAGAGLAVDWEPFGGAHEIPYDVTERLGAFLTELCAA
jgi:phospholipase/carboxylesterase